MRRRTVTIPGRARGGTRRSWATALLALTATAALVAAGSTVAAQAAVPGPDYAALVNPFVGTESEGNAYPGATVPFGMVQLSPDNTNSYASTSYSNNAKRVWGFSHRHVNSAGCPAAGELLVSPSTTAAPQTSRAFTSIKDGTESASAGYYGVTLANDVHVDLSATTRTGAHRYTFPAGTTSNLSFNLGQTLNTAGASSVTFDGTTLEGWLESSGFCGGTATSRYYFSATFDRAPSSVGTWTGSAFTSGKTSNAVSSGGNGFVATFDTTTDREVEVSVGVSYVSVAGARANRVAEATTDGVQTPFDQIREHARDAWNAELGRFDVTASDTATKIFYTQLYKTLLSPNIGSDVDGKYVGLDAKTHTATGWDYYQTFSLWDTYRTQATLHALFFKDRAEDIVRSMYQARVEGGWFPRWSLGSVETNVMAGDPVTPWIAENFTLGTVPDDIADQMWDYLVENATTAPPAGVASVGRQSVAYYLQNGHIPYYPENGGGLGGQFEEYRHGGSATMEWAAADASIGSAAQRLGKTEQAAEFRARGTSWQTLWNPDVELSGGFKGIVNAVTPEGQFVSRPELTDVTTSGFHEGTPWHYQWMATQDVVGLQEKMGGRDAFLERLDYYFNQPALQADPGVSPSTWASGGSAYYTSIGYNPGNEPMLMDAWLYDFVGQPWKTSNVLAANLNRFPDTPGGGVGNDDLGTLGAWYVMATLGFQPVAPGSGIMALNAPRVQAATITLDGGKKLQITAAGADESLPTYISGVTLDGVTHSAAWFDVDQITDGATLDFALSPTAAGLTWGTAQQDWIPSVSAPREVAAPTVTPTTGLTAVAGKASDVELARVAFAPGDGTEPVSATVSWGDGVAAVPATVTAKDGAWVISARPRFATAGTVTGTVTVSAASTPKFAPAAFAPVTATVSVKVSGPAVPPSPTVAAPRFSAGTQVYGATAAKRAKVAAVVTGATSGTVTFKAGSTVLGTAPVARSGAAYTATLTLPATLKVGSYGKVTATLVAGGKTVVSVASAATFKVVKATTKKVTVSAKKFKKGSKPKVTIKVATLSNGQKATGKIKVYVGKKVVKTSLLTAKKKGKIKVTLPKKYTKTIKVKAKFTPKTTKTVKAKTSKTIKVKTKK